MLKIARRAERRTGTLGARSDGPVCARVRSRVRTYIMQRAPLHYVNFFFAALHIGGIGRVGIMSLRYVKWGDEKKPRGG